MATAKTEQQELEDALEAALKENLKLKGDFSRVTGERDYCRNRVRILGPLVQLVLGDDRLPDNNLDLASLVASYFRTAVSTTPESAMTPLLEGIIKSLSPAEETAPAEIAEVSAEELLGREPNK